MERYKKGITNFLADLPKPIEFRADGEGAFAVVEDDETRKQLVTLLHEAGVKSASERHNTVEAVGIRIAPEDMEHLNWLADVKGTKKVDTSAAVPSQGFVARLEDESAARRIGTGRCDL